MNQQGSSLDGTLANEGRGALVIAHPGHELCVYGWIALTRPKVFVVTDGSGRAGKPRIDRTTQIIRELGARPGSIYGRYSDVTIYQALLDHRFDLFINLAHELAAEIVVDELGYLVGDPREGYSPTHDACRLVVNAALAIARRTAGRKIGNYSFAMPGRALKGTRCGQPIRIELEPAMLEQKLNSARQYLELKNEVDTYLSSKPEMSLRSEHIWPENDEDEQIDAVDETDIYYEKYGEERVKQGHYREVIRYREHLLPLAARLQQAAADIHG